MKVRIAPAVEKTELHPRNQHRKRYDFKLLIKVCPELAQFVKLNDYKDESIDFFNAEAVKTLNKALLMHYYEVTFWQIPDQYLCPPIPSRADYIHYMADVLGKTTKIQELKKNIKCLDIGVGSNCVYPIIGVKEYNWAFVGTDIDAIAVATANKIVASNAILKDKVTIRLQPNRNNILSGIIKKDDFFDLVICNPPFHKSLADAEASAIKKLSNLKQQKITKPTLNFGGKSNELWYEGGEANFVKIMIGESATFKTSCLWFSCLISKQSNLENVNKELYKAGAKKVQVIAMSQGNKVSRIVVWSFFTTEEVKKRQQKKI